MAISEKQRWILYSIALGATVAAVRWVEGPSRDAPKQAVPEHLRDKLARRTRSAPADDSVLARLREEVAQARARWSPTSPFRNSPTPSAPVPGRAAEAPSGTAQAELFFSAPAQVTVGREFAMTFTLEGAHSGGTARVALAYDPLVLDFIGVWLPDSTALDVSPPADSGWTLVEIAGPVYEGHPMPTQVRFRVVAKAPTTTQIRIENVRAVDGEGRSLAVTSPQTHRVTILQP